MARARGVRHVDEASAAGVLVEARRDAGVTLGRAVGLRLAVQRAEEVLFGRPVDVAADVEVQPAVAVVVEPGGGGAPAGLADAGLRCDFLETAAEVVEEEVAVQRRDIDVVASVAIVVADRRSHPVEHALEARLTRHVPEARKSGGVVPLVAVECERGLLGGLRAPLFRPESARDEEEVRLSVGIVVEHRDASAHRLRHPLLAARAVDVREVDPERRGLLGEGDRGRGCRSGRRRRRDGGMLGPAAAERETQNAGDDGRAPHGGEFSRDPREAICRPAATDCIHLEARRLSSTGTWASPTRGRPRPLFSGRPVGPRSASRPGAPWRGPRPSARRDDVRPCGRRPCGRRPGAPGRARRPCGHGGARRPCGRRPGAPGRPSGRGGVRSSGRSDERACGPRPSELRGRRPPSFRHAWLGVLGARLSVPSFSRPSFSSPSLVLLVKGSGRTNPMVGRRPSRGIRGVSPSGGARVGGRLRAGLSG